MAYSSSPDVLRERLASPDLGPGLAELSAGRSAAWNTEPGDADRCAYRVRECLYIASLHAEEFPELAQAHQRMGVVVIGNPRHQANRVEAKPKRGAFTPTDPGTVETTAPIQMSGGLGKEVATVGLVNAMQVIDSWRKHQPSNDPLKFTQTNLPQSELAILYRWARTQQPRLMFFVAEGGFLSLAIAEEGVEAHSWSPPRPPAPEERFDI